MPPKAAKEIVFKVESEDAWRELVQPTNKKVMSKSNKLSYRLLP